jgi:hypothetical protein
MAQIMDMMTSNTPTPGSPDTQAVQQALDLLLGKGQPPRVFCNENQSIVYRDTEALMDAFPPKGRPRVLLDDGKGPKRRLVCHVDAVPGPDGLAHPGAASEVVTVARRIAQDLHDRGWPRPLIGVTHRRATLFWACGLPPNSDLPQAFVAALSSQYASEAVHLSGPKPGMALHVPLFGWGTTDDERAECYLLEAPKALVPVATRHIELAAGRPRSQPRPGEPAVEYLESHGIVVSDPKPLADGTTVYRCGSCPCPICHGELTYLTITAKGKAGLVCLSTECAYGTTHHTSHQNWDDFLCRSGGPPDLKNDVTMTLTSEQQLLFDEATAWDHGRSVLPDVKMPKPDKHMARLRKEWAKLHRLRRDMEPFLHADAYAEFVRRWHEALPQPAPVGVLLEFAMDMPELSGLHAQLGRGGDRSQGQKLALILHAHLAEPVHGFRIARVKDAHVGQWLYLLESASS